MGGFCQPALTQFYTNGHREVLTLARFVSMQRSGAAIPQNHLTRAPQEIDMNTTAKKLVVAVAVAAFTLLGAAAPADAAKSEARTIWCC
jgi:hypothetical protein